jgi:predicted nucleic acid-binding protein
MYQVAIDTNVLVAALLSNLGASHRLLRLVGDSSMADQPFGAPGS